MKNNQYSDFDERVLRDPLFCYFLYAAWSYTTKIPIILNF